MDAHQQKHRLRIHLSADRSARQGAGDDRVRAARSHENPHRSRPFQGLKEPTPSNDESYI